eukprot:IDg4073t1
MLSDTMGALIEMLPLPAFSDSASACIELAAKLKVSRAPHSSLDGLICALDGVAIQICKPCLSDCNEQAIFFHKKSYYAAVTYRSE